VADRLGVGALDRLWLFPPLRRGRREWGLVVVSAFHEDGDRRRMHTVRYVAERTGEGLAYEPEMAEEGILPPDRFTRVLAGVARRSEEGLGEPDPVEIAGDPERLEGLLQELDPAEVESWNP